MRSLLEILRVNGEFPSLAFQKGRFEQREYGRIYTICYGVEEGIKGTRYLIL